MLPELSLFVRVNYGGMAVVEKCQLLLMFIQTKNHLLGLNLTARGFVRVKHILLDFIN